MLWNDYLRACQVLRWQNATGTQIFLSIWIEKAFCIPCEVRLSRLRND